MRLNKKLNKVRYTPRKKDNCCVVTLSIGNLDYCNYTLPLMKRYAENHGFDFIVIDKRKNLEIPIHFERFQLKEMLTSYDRILYLDSDIIIKKNTPNVFNYVSSKCLGCVSEYTGNILRKKQIEFIELNIFCQRKNITIPDHISYFNAGMLVLSKCHNCMFGICSKDDIYFFNHESKLLDQTWLNFYVIQNKIKIQILDNRFNSTNWVYNKKHHIPLLNIEEDYIWHFVGSKRSKYDSIKRFYEKNHFIIDN